MVCYYETVDCDLDGTNQVGSLGKLTLNIENKIDHKFFEPCLTVKTTKDVFQEKSFLRDIGGRDKKYMIDIPAGSIPEKTIQLPAGSIPEKTIQFQEDIIFYNEAINFEIGKLLGGQISSIFKKKIWNGCLIHIRRGRLY